MILTDNTAPAPLPADRTAWEAALATFNACVTEDAEFGPHYLKVTDACARECFEEPHVEVRPSASSGLRQLSTADVDIVHRYRKEVARIDAGTVRYDAASVLDEHVKTMRALVAAAEERDAKVAAIRKRHGIAALEDRFEQLGEQVAAARFVLMSMPAPDLAALHWKLGQLREDDGSLVPWSDEYVRSTFLDIARLLPPAG